MTFVFFHYPSNEGLASVAQLTCSLFIVRVGERMNAKNNSGYCFMTLHLATLVKSQDLFTCGHAPVMQLGEKDVVQY